MSPYVESIVVLNKILTGRRWRGDEDYTTGSRHVHVDRDSQILTVDIEVMLSPDEVEYVADQIEGMRR